MSDQLITFQLDDDMHNELVQVWEIAADELGLDLIRPFELALPPDKALHVPLLVKNFGARNGMLIVTDYSVVKPHLQSIADLGFGFSVLEEPRGSATESYDRESMIEMLSDWGWSGEPAQRPAWLKAVGLNN